MTNLARYPSLHGETVIITGGATGIGAALVEAFADQGAVCAFLDNDEAEGRALAARTGARFQPCDLRDIGALQAACAGIIKTCGPPLVLINNAARDDRHVVDEVTPSYFDERIAVNLRPVFFTAQAVLPSMRARKRGSIINLGSISWRLGLGGMPVYLTAKAGIEGLTRALARDAGPQGIRVNTIVPGWVMTERQIKLWLTPEAETELMSRQCLKEKLMPEDIARLTLFLAADDSRMITAQAFVADGGWT